MNSSIVSIGITNPGLPIPQSEIARFMKLAHQLDEVEGRKLGFLYRMSGIESRHSVLNDFDKLSVEDFSFFPNNQTLSPFPGTKARMEVFQTTAPDLAAEAALSCLNQVGETSGSLTHLILVSCTGMVAPGVELQLMEKLGLSDAVERYCIHFMGCYAAFTGLKLADKILRAEPEAKVLVVSVELCTLHFQKEYSEDNILANSLFGDGAAAALVMNSEKGLKINSYLSQVLREGEQDMAWGIGDFGFEMRLSKYIPNLLDQGIRQLKETFERKFRLSQIRNFAIHPGGKQILQKVQEAFGLGPEVNLHSMEVLRKFGNMSSATILFVLDRMMKDADVQGDILSMGFGPGLTLETLHLEKR
ncbi:type III polyketide synthase [Algoriphagus lacus]|uniref:Type III polyketide synthase n=1 Tax=Algoriphagus lacus TaxID=2056311 RepID=A0A418PWH6_9BACT|nr:type III polyketide synthase [Algoriphagus lacus]RIW18508.1 type III polyketide synthase [Algoriphagus lacus]